MRETLLLALALIAVAGGANAEEATALRDCSFVDLAGLIHEPLNYNGQEVCTETLVRVEYEGMTLYTQEMRREDRLYVNVYPPFGVDEAVDQGTIQVTVSLSAALSPCKTDA